MEPGENPVKPQKVHAKEHSSYLTFTLLSLLLPFVGIILGIVYLSKKEPLERKLGEHSIAMSVLGFVLGWLIIAMLNGGTTSTVQNSTSITVGQQESQALEPTPTPTPDTPGFSDGSHAVGTDIKSGTYRLRTAPSGSCYYARVSGFSGEFDEILANDNTSYHSVVTIKDSDKGFISTRCGRWSEDLSRITASMTTFDNGVFIVGTDIEPGTYKSTPASSCYYSRLSGFSGEFDEIISNNNTNDVAIVTIAKTDKGFKSSRCGTWTKQ